MLLCGQLFIENFRIKRRAAECSGCENDGCADAKPFQLWVIRRIGMVQNEPCTSFGVIAFSFSCSCADQNGSFFRSTVRILCRFSGGAPICGTSTY